jgi:glycosyltransferase involved in cell wall biosynthesis/predicted metal-dependent phosphoesterase TrpH
MSPTAPGFASHGTPGTSPPRRIDLHCHSDASNLAAEVVLNAIHCPECYSDPADVYAQARRRGMDFVTITDHDTIAGVLRISDRPDVLVSEELTCWFPEDRCKIHLLVFGITQAQHDELRALAADIYGVAEYVERERIAHSVAHPIYRQNEKLERWHVERMLLLFKGFECLNGAHSGLHREAFEPLLERLTPQEIQRLADTHSLTPRWPEPWIKARTGGSDDHGLLNIGCTWTEFPPQTRTVGDVLECLRSGHSRPGGETGSSAKLAHAFYSVAVRYYSRHIMTASHTPSLATTLLQAMVGEHPAPSRARLATMVVKSRLRKLTQKVWSPFARQAPATPAKYGTASLKRLFLGSARRRLSEHPPLRQAMQGGLPPLSEHDEMFQFVSSINRDVTQGIADAISGCVDDASFTGLFDTIGAILAQQFVLMPYYFAVFHQNKERHLLREITRQHTRKSPETLRIGLFTDTLDDVNGVARFIRDMADQARQSGRHFIVHTCTDSPRVELPNRRNFQPLLSRPLPYYADLKLTLPPLLEVLEWADRQQFDAIHVSTPGPMGLCGFAAAKMLRVPMLATYHTDFPAYLESLSRDHRIVNGALQYMKWFYAQAAGVFSRSRSYEFKLHDLGVGDERIHPIRPGINTERFSPRHRDDGVWGRLGIRQPRRLLYVGRVSVEKNLPHLAEAFRALCGVRSDVALVVAGDGPYLAEMKRSLADLPAFFLGQQNDLQLSPLYAGSDLFVFPSRTDTLGQVVMEAQASGLPALVSDQGGPRELVEDGASGVVVTGRSALDWCRAMDELLGDEPRRQRMARTSAQRADRYSLEQTFGQFWADHLRIVEPASAMDRVPVPGDATASAMRR